MPAENETPDETQDETPDESTETTDSDATETADDTDTGDSDNGDDDSAGDNDADSGNDELANATAMIEQLNGTIEGLNSANAQMLTENSIQIEKLQSTITGLRAELWTATRVLPNDSVSTEDESGSDSPITFDDLVAKATAKESD